MDPSDPTTVWSDVASAAGLSIPEHNQEAFRALTADIQGLVATLRDAGLGETQPAFTFHARPDEG